MCDFIFPQRTASGDLICLVSFMVTCCPIYYKTNDTGKMSGADSTHTVKAFQMDSLS